MNSGLPSGTRLVADVGGTNTRIALYDAARDQLRALGTYINRDFTRFEEVIAHWLEELEEAPPTSGCIAVAAPPGNDRIAMFNGHWTFSRRDLARRFGLGWLRWLNDFESNAYALPFLGPGDCEQLFGDAPAGSGRLAVVGPGTGLGGATVDLDPRGHRATPCEPGHMGLAPADEEELELLRLLLPRHESLYAELLVSGPGLQRLYETLARLRGEPVVARNPAEVSGRALTGDDPLCAAALDRFCGLLGSVCGDFILATGSYGGLYLAGGIIPRILPFLRESSFHRRLMAKGAMRAHLAAVPVLAITTPNPGLLGAAHAPLDLA